MRDLARSLKGNSYHKSLIQLELLIGSIKVENTSFEYRIDEGEGIPCIAVGMANMYPGTFLFFLEERGDFEVN